MAYIYIYPIRCATSRHRAYNLLAYQRTSVTVSSPTLVPFQRPLGGKILNLGSLWEPFCDFWAPFRGFGALLGAIWRRNRFWGVPREKKLTPLGTLLGTPIHKNREQRSKKRCPESSVEKTCSPSSPPNSQCVIHTLKNICFVRSRSVHLGGFGAPFGSLLGSLWVTFSKKVAIRGAQKSIKNKHRKLMIKGHAVNLANGV